MTFSKIRSLSNATSCPENRRENIGFENLSGIRGQKYYLGESIIGRKFEISLSLLNERRVVIIKLTTILVRFWVILGFEMVIRRPIIWY